MPWTAVAHREQVDDDRPRIVDGHPEDYHASAKHPCVLPFILHAHDPVEHEHADGRADAKQLDEHRKNKHAVPGEEITNNARDNRAKGCAEAAVEQRQARSSGQLVAVRRTMGRGEGCERREWDGWCRRGRRVAGAVGWGGRASGVRAKAVATRVYGGGNSMGRPAARLPQETSRVAAPELAPSRSTAYTGMWLTMPPHAMA